MKTEKNMDTINGWKTSAPEKGNQSSETRTTIIKSPAEELTGLQGRFFSRKEAAVTDLQDFFGEASRQLVTLTLEVNVLDLLMTQRALAHFLSDWEIVRECAYDANQALLVKRLAVETAPNVYDFVIRYGRQFWRGVDDQKV